MFKVHSFKDQEIGWGVKQNVKRPSGLHFGAVDFLLSGEEKTSSGTLKSMKKVEGIWRLKRGKRDWERTKGKVVQTLLIRMCIYKNGAGYQKMCFSAGFQVPASRQQRSCMHGLFHDRLVFPCGTIKSRHA